MFRRDGVEIETARTSSGTKIERNRVKETAKGQIGRDNKKKIERGRRKVKRVRDNA